MEARHIPVLLAEVLAALRVRREGRYIDCTVGEAGHSVAIMDAAVEARLLGIDLDPDALAVARQRLSAYEERVALVRGNFADLDDIAEAYRFEDADAVLFDLGLSSLQVDTESRGFSFRREARLDMRFDPTQEVTAHQVVNDTRQESLAEIIWRFGEEPRARRVARAVLAERPIETTTRLAEVVARAVGSRVRRGIHPATRTFQAIRIAVNRELENIGQGLNHAIGALATGGRLAVISYHSLEDRLVKGVIRREAASCICPPETPQCVCDHSPRVRLIGRRAVKPTTDEIQANPRSRSARLRVVERI